MRWSSVFFCLGCASAPPPPTVPVKPMQCLDWVCDPSPYAKGPDAEILRCIGGKPQSWPCRWYCGNSTTLGCVEDPATGKGKCLCP